MKNILYSAYKKHVLFFNVMLPLLSTFSVAGSVVAPQASASVTTPVAAYNFPTAEQAFKKIYSGDLSVDDAVTQPWFESYDRLYKQMHKGISDSALVNTPSSTNPAPGLLNKLQKKTVTPDTAATQFKKAQNALKAAADSVFSS